MKFSKICVILFIVVDILYIKSLVSEKVVDIYAIRSICLLPLKNQGFLFCTKYLKKPNKMLKKLIKNSKKY